MTKNAGAFFGSLLIFLFSWAAHADPAEGRVDCEQFRYQLETLSRADQFSLIGIYALDPALRDLQQDRLDREMLRRLHQDILNSVPQECRSQVERRATHQWSMRMVANYGGRVSAQGLGTDGIQMTAYKLIGWSNSYRHAYYRYDCGSPTDDSQYANYYNCINAHSQETTNGLLRDFSTLSASQLREKLIWYYGAWAQSNLANVPDSAIDVLRNFTLALGYSQNADEFYRSSANFMSHASSDDRALYVVLYGVYLDWGYDMSRLDHSSPTSRGPIGDAEIFNAAHNNFFQEAYVSQNAHPSQYWDFAGVCRDIAAAQGKLAEHIGFENVYLVRLQTPDNSGHVAVIAQDPNDPNRTYGFNYGMHISHNNTAAIGSVAVNPPALLDSGLRDTSTVYRLYNANAHPVTTIQSEMGVWLNQLAGLTPFDPLNRTLPQSAFGSVRNPGTGLEFRAGIGIDTVGNSYAGVSTSETLFQRTRFPLRLGIAFASQGSNSNFGGGSTSMQPSSTINLNIFYAYIQQEALSRSIDFHNEQLHLRIEALAQGIFQLTHMSGGSSDINGDNAVDADFRVNVNARIDQNNPWRDRFSATYRVGSQLTYASHDIRNGQSWYVPLVQHFLFSAHGRYRLQQSPEGRAYLIAATIVLVDMIGVRGRSVLGISTPYVTASGYIEGRIIGFHEGGVPLWQPSAQRRIGTTVEVHSDRSAVGVFVSGSVSIDPATPRDYRIVGGIQVSTDARRTRRASRPPNRSYQ